MFGWSVLSVSGVYSVYGVLRVCSSSRVSTVSGVSTCPTLPSAAQTWVTAAGLEPAPISGLAPEDIGFAKFT